MTIGEKIKESRRARGLRGEDLAGAIGTTTATISKIELDMLKFGPSPDLVVKISEALGDRTILTTYLENNPVYQSIIPKIFPDLNNIRLEPAIIFTRFAAEARESANAADILAEMFSNADPKRLPEYERTLKAQLEQVVDVQRAAEILFLQLIVSGVISDEDRGEIHRAQQQKCVDHGHHDPEKEAV